MNKIQVIEAVSLIVKQQGTLVQEEGFEQVPVLHIGIGFEFRGSTYVYLGDQKAFTRDGLSVNIEEVDEDILCKFI